MGMPVPSLSGGGWITGVQEKANYLMGYFLVSQFSQSIFYRGKIASLPWLISQYSQDTTRLQFKIQEALRNMMEAYFDSTQISVTVNPWPDDPSRLDIKVDAVLIDGGVPYSLGKLLQAANGVLKNVTDIYSS